VFFIPRMEIDMTTVRLTNAIRDEIAKKALEKSGIEEELKQQYFGTKDYAHWRDQRENHLYGYGPKHGSIVFEVGLTRVALEKAGSVGIEEDDIESAIYCLLNIDEINKQKSNAKAA
ncbi:hypothetical protein ACTXJW_22025, partial [Hafnia alvei]